MKMLLSFIYSLLLSALCVAETVWYNPIECGAQVHGQGWKELENTYFRLPESARLNVRPAVWDLSRQSAGLSIVFRCDASDIQIRYKVADGLSMFHMPSTGVSGIDLYAIDADGVRRWCCPDFPPSFSKEEINYKYSDFIYYPDARRYYEYHLYLPLYNSVEWIEIGVPEGARMDFLPASAERPIVVYGTSIAQGACASRPGNAWSNIIQRELEHPVVNLGFSGNGKLEPEIFKLMSQIDARLYIIDCMPNMENAPDVVTERVLSGVKMLRSNRECPILLVEHSGCKSEVSETRYEKRILPDNGLRAAYNELVDNNVDNIYYMTAAEMDMVMDGMVEGTHPNDYGMRRLADAYERKIREILHEKTGIFEPCTQHRASYMWYDRHEQALEYCTAKKPKVVLLGDSITHQWGGNPVGHLINGPESWADLWGKQNTVNLGFGWDRIENLLWRIYHGELDGYEAEEIYILIGTNNLEYRTIEQIADGICEVVDAVAYRQPNAKIYVCGIMPRKGKEGLVRNANGLIRTRLQRDKAKYIDVTPLLVKENGRIRQELFHDGLHPNEEGYKKVAEMIKAGK